MVKTAKIKNKQLNRAILRGVFLVLIVMLLSISTISAMKIDNVKNVNWKGGKYPQLEIKNLFGIGSSLWKGNLDSNTDTCGINCEAITTIELNKKGSLIDDVIFETILADGSRIEQDIRSYQFYIKTDEEQFQVDDYETQCENGEYNSNNNSYEQICERVKTGFHLETKPLWEKYSLGIEMPKGTYEVKLEGEKKPSRSVDWIIQTQGEWLDEWAVWDGRTLYEYYDGAENDQYDVRIGRSVGQTFTIGTTGANETFTVTSVSLNGSALGTSANKDIWVYIYSANVSTNATIGEPIAYSDAISINNWSADNVWVNVSLSTTGILEKGQYYVLAINSSALDSGNSFSWNTITTASAYPTGTAVIWDSNDVGGVPDETPPRDQLFKIWGGGFEIKLNSPTNNYISTSNSVEFNCSATTDESSTLINISLIHNGTGVFEINQTIIVSSIGEVDFWDGVTAFGNVLSNAVARGVKFQALDDVALFKVNKAPLCDGTNVTLWNEAYDTVLASAEFVGDTAKFTNINLINQTIYRIEVHNNGASYQNDFTSSINYGLSDNGKINVTTGSLAGVDIGGNQFNIMNISFSNLTSTFYEGIFNTTITEPILWTCQACDSDGDCGFATENRTVLVDTAPPTITINSPSALEDIRYADGNETLNWTITDTNFASAWYNYNGTNVSLIGASNQTIFQLDGNDRNLTFYANDSVGNVNSTLVEWVYKVFVNEEIYSETAIEGNTETFAMNITWDNNTYSSVDGYLNYNGVRQSIATKTGSGGSAYLTKDISIPAVATDTNYTFLWEFLLGGEYINSTSLNQSVSNIDLAICNSTNYQDLVINMSLYDEETNTYINNTALDSNIEIDLQISSRDSGITIIDYANQWTNQNNVSLCLANDTLDSVDYQIDYVITFSSDDHITEYLYMDNGTLDNSSSFNSLTDKSMFLMNLLSADSTSFLFNYLDSDGLVVDDIIVHAFRKYVGEGIFREIERAKQNDDGNTVVHLVEEDVIYYFIISKFSEILFTSNTYTALCQSTPCEIELSEAGGFEEFGSDWDLIDDGAYTVNSNDVTREVNLSFETTDSSTFTFTIYRLNSTAGYESVGTDNATGTSGTLLITIPASSGNESFFGVVEQDGEYIKSEWIDMEENAGVYFGDSLSIFLAILIILTLSLMAISEGSGTILFLILGLFLVMILGLADFATAWGLNILIYLIIAGGLLVWKLTRKNR